MQAINQMFPELVCFGCDFHWKNTVKNYFDDDCGLKGPSDNENKSAGKYLREFISRLMMLAYVRPAEVPMFFNAIVTDIEKKYKSRISTLSMYKGKVIVVF